MQAARADEHGVGVREALRTGPPILELSTEAGEEVGIPLLFWVVTLYLVYP